MTKDELVARLRDIEWGDFEVKAAKLWYGGIAENAGYGMNKLASWEALTGTRPTIESDRTIATVSFPLKSAVQTLVSTDTDVPVNVAKNVAKKLTERQQQIIALISENPHITRAAIADAIGVATKTVERELAELSGIVRYVGPKRGGHWEVEFQE